MFNDIYKALSAYSEEWEVFVTNNFMAKCDACGYCVEARCCGKKPTKEAFFKTYNIGLALEQLYSGEKTISDISDEMSDYLQQIIEKEVNKRLAEK